MDHNATGVGQKVVAVSGDDADVERVLACK